MPWLLLDNKGSALACDFINPAFSLSKSLCSPLWCRRDACQHVMIQTLWDKTTIEKETRLVGKKNTMKEIQQFVIPWEQLVKIEINCAVSAGWKRQTSWACVLQSESTGSEYDSLLLLETMMSFPSVSVSFPFPKLKSLTLITLVFVSTAKTNQKKSSTSRHA